MHYSHVAQFAGSDENVLVARVAEYFRDALAHDGVCVAVTGAARREALTPQLPPDAGVIWLDAHDVLRDIVDGTRIDPIAFGRRVGDVMRKVVRQNGSRPVYAYGDMVDVLWHQSKRQTAAELERFWNDLGTYVPFTLFCGYTIDPNIGNDGDVQQIAALHSAVLA
jgi:hypothetical protein